MRKPLKKLPKIPPLFTFAILYGLLAVVLTSLFRFLPTAVSLENELFDRIQESEVIDAQSDARFARFKPYLNQLTFINLDTAFIDSETDRVRQKPVAALLDKLQPLAQGDTKVFLDYLLGRAPDTTLQQAVAKWGKTLILPHELPLKEPLTLRGAGAILTRERVDSFYFPQTLDCARGYTPALTDPFSFANRYYKYKADDGSFYSVPELLNEGGQKNNTEADNGVKELNFVLRNGDLPGKFRAVLVYQASDIMAGKIPPAELNALLLDKKVLIGLFEGYTTKYGAKIESFLTPVQSDMTGPLLLANAWINRAANCALKSHNWFILFILNIIIALTVDLKYDHERRKTLASIINTGIKMGISLILFYYLSVAFFRWGDIKLSLGMTLFLYQQLSLCWTWYKEIMGKSHKSDDAEATETESLLGV